MRPLRESSSEHRFDPETTFASLPALTGRQILYILIAAGLLLRLYAFDGPILDHHYLRQVDTAAIARNFAEEGMNILYPSVDWRGSSTGYVESEFPIYTYLVAAFYRVFGEHVEIARALNLVFFVLTALVLFDFARRMFSALTALLSVFFYSFMPLTAYFAHSYQPDTLMLLASLSAVYFFWLWADEGKSRHLAFSAAALCVALLIKPLNLYLAVPLFYLCYRRFGWGLLADPRLWAYGVAVLVPPLIWYLHAYQLWIEHGNTLFRAYSSLDFTWLWKDHYPSPLLSLKRGSYVSDLVWRVVYLIATPAGLLLLLVGAGVAIRKRHFLLIAWVASFALTMVLFAYQHRAHDYYQLPMAIIASVLMAAGVMRLWSGSQVPRLLIGVLCAAYVLVSAHWMWKAFLEFRGGSTPVLRISDAVFGASAFLLLAWTIWPRHGRTFVVLSLALTATQGAAQMAQLTTPQPFSTARQAFGARIQALTRPGAPIVMAQNVHRPGWFQHRTAQGELLGYMPLDFYLGRRKGWSASGEQISPARLETLRERGARYFAEFCCEYPHEGVLSTHPALRAYLECAHTPLEVTDTYSIYLLDPPRRRPDGSSCLTAGPSAG